MLYKTKSGLEKIGLTLTPKGKIATRNKKPSILFEVSKDDKFHVEEGQQESYTPPPKKPTRQELQIQKKEEKEKKEKLLMEEKKKEEKEKKDEKELKDLNTYYSQLLKNAKNFNDELSIYNDIKNRNTKFLNQLDIYKWFRNFELYLPDKLFDIYYINELKKVSKKEINKSRKNILDNVLLKRQLKLWEKITSDKKPTEKQHDNIKLFYSAIWGKIAKLTREIKDAYLYKKTEVSMNNFITIAGLKSILNKISFYLIKYKKDNSDEDNENEDEDKNLIDKILDEVEKYQFLVCDDKKCKIVSSGETKKEAKDNLIELLEPKWENLIGTTIYFVKIEKSKENWDKIKDKLVPGPVMMGISDYRIEKDNKLKFYDSGINGNVYFSEEYLNKYETIKNTDIENMVLKYKKRELKQGLMSKNIL